jgi:hypothetical protein
MKRFLAVGLLGAFSLGCGPAGTPMPDETITYRTGAETVAGVEWSYAIVCDQASGDLLYVAVVYGRGVLAEKEPSRGAVPVDDKAVTVPSADGSLFVIDSSLNCHRAPLAPQEVKELVREQAAGTLYAGASWWRLQPFLRLYEADE